MVLCKVEGGDANANLQKNFKEGFTIQEKAILSPLLLEKVLILSFFLACVNHSDYSAHGLIAGLQ